MAPMYTEPNRPQGCLTHSDPLGLLQGEDIDTLVEAARALLAIRDINMDATTADAIHAVIRRVGDVVRYSKEQGRAMVHDNEGDAPPSRVDCGYCDGDGKIPNMDAGYCFCGGRAELRKHPTAGGQDAWHCACGITWPALSTPREHQQGSEG